MSDPTLRGDAAPLLRERRFLCLWLVGAIVGTVRWLEMLAISLYTLRATESALAVSLMVFARILPPLLLGAVVGALADRVDRKRLYLAGLIAQVLVAATLAALAMSGSIALWQIAAGAVIGGVLFSLEHPVRRPMLGDVAGPSRIGRALSLDSASFNATRMAGPLFGGVVFELVGLHGAYLVSVALCAAAAGLLASVSFNMARGAAPARTGASSFGDGLRQGLAIARADRTIAAVLAATVILNLFGFAYVSLVPVVGERVLELGAVAVGSLMAMEGLGALVGALLLAASVQPRNFMRAFTAGAFLVLVAVLAFSLSRWAPLSHGLLFVAGFGLACFGAMQSTLLLVAAPQQARSRVMGLLVMCIGAQPLGVLHAGLLAEWFDASMAMSIISIEGLVVLSLALRTWPELSGKGN